jgi:hypothetical protein
MHVSTLTVISTASDHANHSKSPEPLLLSFQGAEVPTPSIRNRRSDKLRETRREDDKPTAKTTEWQNCYFSAKLDTNLEPS